MPNLKVSDWSSLRSSSHSAKWSLKKSLITALLCLHYTHKNLEPSYQIIFMLVSWYNKDVLFANSERSRIHGFQI